MNYINNIIFYNAINYYNTIPKQTVINMNKHLLLIPTKQMVNNIIDEYYDDINYIDILNYFENTIYSPNVFKSKLTQVISILPYCKNNNIMLYKIIKKWHYFLSYEAISSILNYCYDNINLIKKYCSKETNYMNLNKIYIRIVLSANGIYALISCNEIENYNYSYIYNFKKIKQLILVFKKIKVNVIISTIGIFLDSELNNKYFLQESKFIDNIGVHERIYNKIICL